MIPTVLDHHRSLEPTDRHLQLALVAPQAPDDPLVSGDITGNPAPQYCGPTAAR